MTNRPMRIWSGTEWVDISPASSTPATTYQASAPTSPNTGDIWIDSDADVRSISPSTVVFRQGTEGIVDLSNTQAFIPPYTMANRNLLYNGAMQVAQRGVNATGITASSFNTADRWVTVLSSLGTWTQTVDNDAPTGSGFRKSLKMTCTTSSASPSAGSVFTIRQQLEGQDVQRLAKGTPLAQQLTLSFWVKSNVIGTFVARLLDNTNSRSVSSIYTISALNVWEQKKITFVADTIGSINNDNNSGLLLDFFLAAGSNFTSGTLNTAWQTDTAANNAPGLTNLASATGNYWQITGVQLEVGPSATPFEFKSYGNELRECQRYYYMHLNGAGYLCAAYNFSSTVLQAFIPMPVTMRIPPTVSSVSGTNFFYHDKPTGADYFNSLSLVAAANDYAIIGNSTEISGTAGYTSYVYCNSSSTYLAFNSEL